MKSDGSNGSTHGQRRNGQGQHPNTALAVIRRQDDQKARFLEALRDSRNVTASHEYAGIGHTTVYDWRRDDEEFRAAWDEALACIDDRLESCAVRIALRGRRKTEIIKGGRYGDIVKMSKEDAPEVVLELLRAYRPSIFRAGQSGVGSAEDFARQIREARAAMDGLTAPGPEGRAAG